MTKDTFLDWDGVTVGNNTDVGGVNIAEGCAPAGINNAIREEMRQTKEASDNGNILGSGYLTKSSGYTVLKADRGKTIDCTAALTLALTAAATVGAGWLFFVKANGGDVTIDPDGSETIDGSSTIIVRDGASVMILCDGSNFHTVFRPSPEETVFSGAMSSASSQTFTGLSAYRHLIIRGFLLPGTDAVTALMQFSTDNGSSYDTGTNYSGLYMEHNNGTPTPAGGYNGSVAGVWLYSGYISSTYGTQFSLEIFNFNQALNANIIGDVMMFSSASARTQIRYSMWHVATTARNAFRFLPSAGNISGWIDIKGIRG